MVQGYDGEFCSKRVAIAGMARTGLAAAPVLRRLGASVLLSDSAPADRLGPKLDEALALGVDVVAGATPQQALDGCDLVVPSPGIPRHAPILQMAVQRGMPILSEIEVAYRIARAPILAITGTNGKTTSTVWLGDMVRSEGRRVYIAGNIAADEMKLALISAADTACEKDVIVAEISSFQLEWVQRFRPKVGIITNITPDHMNRHATFEEYAGCKGRLFAAQTGQDVAVLNAQNAPCRALRDQIQAQPLWFGLADCGEANAAFRRDGQVVVRWQGSECTLCGVNDLRLIGEHNLENALATAGAAIAFGARQEAIATSLTTFGGVVHRMEPVAQVDGVTYINNSMCTNVDAAVRSLEAMDRPTVVIAGGASKNSQFGPLGKAIAHIARHLVLIGAAADEIEAETRAHGYTAISRAATMEQAVQLASSVAHTGDAVMLSPGCASFDMYADFEQRGEAFRSAVRQLKH